MAATVMKVEVEAEVCSVCGRGGDLMTPEEYDAGAPPIQVPLRTMLLHLNNNKVIPEGRLCTSCVQRATEAYEFSSALSSRTAPPLSEKIRALRRRLHELTQKIDVFIVVGGPGAGAGNAYSEDDIIMVEKDALAAAAAADDEELEHARNAKGDNVYQCSVCPLSFQRVSEYRAHMGSHPADSQHSCWTCGAQFSQRSALREHAAEHTALHALTCYLCDINFQTQSELRKHEASGACTARCPACGLEHETRAALGAHAAAAHGRTGAPPHVCPCCFRTFPAAELLSAHLLRHRQDKQFVCGYADCVLRFATRSHLMAHIRKCHAAELPPDQPEPALPASSHTCDLCNRTFASAAALKRHARVHREPAPAPREAPAAGDAQPQGDHVYEYEQYQLQQQDETVEGVEMEYQLEEGEVEMGDGEGEVEYLEVETLEEGEEYEEYELKHDPTQM